MSNKDWVADLIASVAGVDRPTADSVVERLMEEGVLHLGHGNADIDLIVDTFADAFGSTKVSRQDRWAANRLAGKYGSQAVRGIIQILKASQDERFAPVVNSVAQLEEKMPSVLNFLRKAKGDETIETN